MDPTLEGGRTLFTVLSARRQDLQAKITAGPARIGRPEVGTTTEQLVCPWRPLAMAPWSWVIKPVLVGNDRQGVAVTRPSGVRP